MSDDETWANLTNGTGQAFPEVTLEELANTARWMRFVGVWYEIGVNVVRDRYAARLAAAGMTLHDDGTITSQRVLEPKKPRRPPPPSWTRAMFRRGGRR